MPPFPTGDANPNRKKRAKPNPPPDFVPGGINRGRPPTYRVTYDEIVRRLRLLMMTREEIAKFFGVSPTTIDLWCRKYESFNVAYAQGGEEADLDVVQSLRHRAIGYSHKAEKIMLGPGGTVLREEYTEHYPPDTAAASLWLSNRQRGRWKLGNSQEPENPDKSIKINVTGGLPDE